MKKEKDIFSRELPQSIEAEKAILSSMIIDNKIISDILEKVKDEMFYTTAHQTIFSSIVELHKNNVSVESVTLYDYITTNDLVSKIGSVSYINEFQRVVASTSNIEYYISILIEKYTRREMIKRANEIIDNAYSNKSLNDIVDEGQQSIFEINLKDEKKDLILVKDELQNTLINIQDYDKISHISTGIKEIDTIIKHLNPKSFNIIGARPSVGKTSLGLNIALAMSNQIKDKEKKRKVAFYSLETTTDTILKRLISITTQVDCKHGLKEGEFQQIVDRIVPLQNANIYINDCSTIKTIDIKNQIRKMKQKQQDIDVVIIDYIQLMKPVHTKKSDNRNLELGEISRELKILAKELDIIIICLAQLNRESEKSNKAPTPTDLRDCGQIEQDADIILLLYKTEDVKKSTDNEIMVNFNLAKNKDGATGFGALKFRKDISSFIN